MPDFSSLCSDVIFHVLLFLETKDVFTWLNVSKYWLDRCKLVPIKVSLNFKHPTMIEKLVECPRLMNLTSLTLSEPAFGKFEDCGNLRERIVSCKQLQNVTSLGIRGYCRSESWQLKLLSNPYLTKVTDLDLSTCFLEGDVASSLSRIGNLKRLNISHNPRCNVESIAQSEFMSNLTSLNAHEVDRSDSNAKWIASSPFMKNLTELHLGCSNPKRRVLGVVYYIREEISNEGVASISNSSYMRNLKHLYLRDGKITNKGVKLLLDSEHLKSLEMLDLSGNGIVADEMTTREGVHVIIDDDTM